MLWLFAAPERINLTRHIHDVEVPLGDPVMAKLEELCAGLRLAGIAVFSVPDGQFAAVFHSDIPIFTTGLQ